MIHKYKQGDMFFVLDVNSGAVHTVEEIVYDVLDFYPSISAIETIKELMDKYPEQDIKEAISEIDELIELEQLFCPEDPELITLEENYRKNKVIKALCLHVAHDCNLRCKYCFASQGNFEGEKLLMPIEIAKKAIDFLVENSGSRHNLEVDFFGGEPLMNFDVVKQTVEYARSIEKQHNKNFRFTITTNGVLLDDEKSNYINNNMHNVVLSIDGRKSVNDNMRPTITGGSSYDIILNKFKDLVSKRDKSYYVRGTYTNQNVDFSEDVKHLHDVGFDSISVEPVVADSESFYAISESDLPALFKQYELLADDIIEKNRKLNPYTFFHFAIDLSQGPCVIKRVTGCGAGSEYIAITPEGDIYPCHQFVGKEEFVMGNVLGNLTFDENKVRNYFSEALVYNKPKCRQCWAKFYCSGGCHANAFNFNGDIMVPYEIACELERKRIECAIYIKGQLLV